MTIIKPPNILDIVGRKPSRTVGNTSVQKYVTVLNALFVFLMHTIENCSQILRNYVKFDVQSLFGNPGVGGSFLVVLCRFPSCQIF